MKIDRTEADQQLLILVTIGILKYFKINFYFRKNAISVK